jgi:hypothetical protein
VLNREVIEPPADSRDLQAFALVHESENFAVAGPALRPAGVAPGRPRSGGNPSA